ncbi:MAG: geranylgeranyl diphosphate synthase type I [Acidimicrobiales bacterium]|jgi:geranylgeranyl diphosphate synthase, type I
MSDTPSGLTEVAQLVDRRLAALFDEQEAIWAAIDERLVEAIAELRRITMGGKRLRAGFCYWAWLGATGGSSVGQSSPRQSSLEQVSDADHATIIDACASFELLQAFALIHDDIMDDADRRRSEQTIHVAQANLLVERGWRGEPRRYGEGVAILVGDLSHVYADQLIGNASPQTRELWDRLRIELNLGQYLDMRTAAAAERDRTTAIQVATFKSALYTIVRPLQVGASIAHSATGELDNSALMAGLEKYGIPAGQAFQLRDDLLGVLGDESTIGKPVGNDLREGKPTELVAVAFERATSDERLLLDRIGQPDLDDTQIVAIIDVLKNTGAVDEIESRIDELVGDAALIANDLPFSLRVRETLIAFANYVAARHL